MNLESFLEKLKDNPKNTAFEDTISVIDSNYDFTPCEFSNGDLLNAANQNNGSCKIFAFAKLHRLTEEETLHCFGDYYRKDVLEHPDANDHQNIRNFISTGWHGITYKNDALTPKQS